MYIKRELSSMDQFYELYVHSMKRRKTAFTALNAHSSRSHAIFTIHIEQTQIINDRQRTIKGKIAIADLAGSENNKRTENKGDRLTESKNINRSLSALGRVIEALNKKKAYNIPYRDSILTRLLQDSLGGDNISTMIVCVSGSIDDALMMRRCLEFGSQTRKIKNNVIAHIENKANKENNNNENKSRRNNERKRKMGHGSGLHKKRRMANQHRNRNNSNSNSYTNSTTNSNSTINTSNISTTSSTMNQSLLMENDVNNINISPQIDKKKKKKIRYSMQATPSKFIPHDEDAINKHDEIARNKMLKKIDELTEQNQQMRKEMKKMREESMEKKEKEEREVSVYANDEHGLPPVYKPKTANATLCYDVITKASKYEKNGKLKQALIQYKDALKLLPNHKGLNKKIKKLTLSLVIYRNILQFPYFYFYLL